MKRDYPNPTEENGKVVNNKRVDVTGGGQIHAMFTSSIDVPSRTDLSELGEDD